MKRKSGILDNNPTPYAVMHNVAQKREQARLKQYTLMAEVQNCSALLLFELDGNSLPPGVAIRRDPEVSPDEKEQMRGEKVQKKRTRYGLPSSAQEAAALIHAGRHLPSYWSVVGGQQTLPGDNE